MTACEAETQTDTGAQRGRAPESGPMTDVSVCQRGKRNISWCVAMNGSLCFLERESIGAGLGAS